MIRSRQRQGYSFKIKSEEEVTWLLKTLLVEQQRFLAGLTNVMDEFERLMQADAKAKELVSSYIASVVGDLSIITEAIRQVSVKSPMSLLQSHGPMV